MVPNKPDKIKYITVDEIVTLHKEILDVTGGDYGILNYGNLEFVVDFIQSQIFTMEITDIFYLGALIARGIISGHPFVDGNKRAGIEATDLFLRKNRYYLEMNLKEGLEFTFSVAKNEMDIKTISKWLRKHSKKV
jgi:death-on-curing protein